MEVFESSAYYNSIVGFLSKDRIIAAVREIGEGQLRMKNFHRFPCNHAHRQQRIAPQYPASGRRQEDAAGIQLD